LEVESGSMVRLDETSIRLDDGSGRRSQGLLHFHPQKPSYID
jgi:hypothetical protein